MKRRKYYKRLRKAFKAFQKEFGRYGCAEVSFIDFIVCTLVTGNRAGTEGLAVWYKSRSDAITSNGS